MLEGLLPRGAILHGILAEHDHRDGGGTKFVRRKEFAWASPAEEGIVHIAISSSKSYWEIGS